MVLQIAPSVLTEEAIRGSDAWCLRVACGKNQCASIIAWLADWLSDYAAVKQLSASIRTLRMQWLFPKLHLEPEVLIFFNSAANAGLRCVAAKYCSHALNKAAYWA